MDRFQQNQGAIESVTEYMQALKFSTHGAIVRFTEENFKFESVYLDLEIEYDDAKFKLKQAQLAKKFSDIKIQYDVMKANPYNIEMKCGEDLIGMSSHGSHPLVAEAKKLVEEAKKQFGGTSVNSSASDTIFKIPSTHSLVCEH